MTRQHWKYLSLLLWLPALLLAAWTFRQLPVGDIVAGLKLLSWHESVLWLLVNITIVYLGVKRWQVLAQAADSHLSLSRLFQLRQAGSAISFLTPGPHFGGEPLQLYWLHRYCRLPLHRAVALLGMDRFIETGTNIVVLLAGVLMLFSTTLLPVGDGLQIATILATVLTVMLMMAALLLRHPVWLAGQFLPMAQRWRQRSGLQDESNNASGQDGGWQTFVALLRRTLSQHRPQLWLALLMSLGTWAALLCELVLLLNFLRLTTSWHEVVLIMVGMRLAMLLPVPGGIGTIEASLLWSFQLLGLPVGTAAGLIALIRLRDAVVLLIGLTCLISIRGTLKR